MYRQKWAGMQFIDKSIRQIWLLAIFCSEAEGTRETQNERKAVTAEVAQGSVGDLSVNGDANI